MENGIPKWRPSLKIAIRKENEFQENIKRINNKIIPAKKLKLKQ